MIQKKGIYKVKITKKSHLLIEKHVFFHEKTCVKIIKMSKTTPNLIQMIVYY